jgi:hypothetical protein
LEIIGEFMNGKDFIYIDKEANLEDGMTYNDIHNITKLKGYDSLINTDYDIIKDVKNRTDLNTSFITKLNDECFKNLNKINYLMDKEAYQKSINIESVKLFKNIKRILISLFVIDIVIVGVVLL